MPITSGRRSRSSSVTKRRGSAMGSRRSLSNSKLNDTSSIIPDPLTVADENAHNQILDPTIRRGAKIPYMNLALPSSIHSATCVSAASIVRRKEAIRYARPPAFRIKDVRDEAMDNSNMNVKKRPSEVSRHVSSPLKKRQVDPSDNSNNNHDKKESILSPGPTPYWKVANEREGEQKFSPPMTRSASKRRQEKEQTEHEETAWKHKGGGGVTLFFSPPNQVENEQRERALLKAKELERARRISEARSCGQLLVFSPTFREPTQKEKNSSDTYDDQEHNKQSTPDNSIGDRFAEDDDTTAETAMEISAFVPEELSTEWDGTQTSDQSEKASAMENSTVEAEKLIDPSTDTSDNALEQNDQAVAIVELEQRKSFLEQELTQAHQRVGSFEQKLHSTMNAHEDLLGQFKALENDLQQLQHQDSESRQQHKSEMALLKVKLRSTEENFCNTKVENEKNQQDLVRSEKRVADIEQKLRSTMNAKEGLLRHIKSLERDLERLQNQMSDMQRQHDSEKALLEAELRSTEEHFRNYEANDEMAAEQLEQIMRDEKRVVDIEERLRLTMNDREGLLGQIKSLAHELEMVQSQSVEMQEQYESKIAILETKLRLAEEYVRNKEMYRETTTKQLELLQSENEQLAALLESSNQEAEHYRDESQKAFARLEEQDLVRREIHGRLLQLMGNIRVFVRVRPVLSFESSDKIRLQDERVVQDDRKRKQTPLKQGGHIFWFPGICGRNASSCLGEKTSSHQISADDLTKDTIELQEPYKDRGGLTERRRTWRFGFDKVFTPDQDQADVWDATEPLIQCVVDGFNVTLFAYGQTGSGKTYTMLGEPGHEGVITRSISKLFGAKEEIESLSKGRSKVSLAVELLEVYNEKVRDLLAPEFTKGRELKVTSREVLGNTVTITTTKDDVTKILGWAQGRRCVKATSSNAQSSRSHLIFTIHFEITQATGATRSGKLTICDLAGSERLSKSGADAVGGTLLEETKHINKSLSALSNVIEKLQAGDKNVPFRDSTLTTLLKDSLQGNSKTLAIVCCNPHIDHFHESLCSLRFAEKVNRIELKAKANFQC